MRVGLWALVAGAVAASTAGCGAMVLRGHEVDPPRPWPLVAGASNESKPTLLIRMPDVPAEAKDRKDDTYTANEFKAAIECGLFSTVAYAHPGLGSTNVGTDFILDVSIDHDLELRWYSYVGALTLGAIPLSVPEVFTVSAVLYDAEHRELARFREHDHIQCVLWLPLLPLNAAFSTIVPGGSLVGLDRRDVDSDRRETVEDLLATILAKANNQFHFTATRPHADPH